MVQVKLENKKKIGILGGTFDPAHRGHVKISLEAKKRYGINKIIWAITKKNPYKSKSEYSLNERIKFAKKINSKNRFIKVKCYENIIKSNRTIDLIKYIKRKNKNTKIYFIMGADNLRSFHKWKNYKQILQDYSIYVYPRPNIEVGHQHKNIHIIQDVPQIEISASFIRKSIKEGKNVSYLMPEKAWKYIDEMNFYK